MEGEVPKLARRSMNRKSTMKSGRVIGESRERLETASERTAAHKKIKRRQISRIIVTVLGLTAVVVVLFYIGTFFIHGDEESLASTTVVIPYAPTIPIEDQDASTAGGYISSRTKEYIGQLESDLREYGYQPVKAVLPTGSVREIDFYLDGYKGYIKATLDRGTGVTAEDTDRMLRYLAAQGITDFEYIDVRLDRKAFWK